MTARKPDESVDAEILTARPVSSKVKPERKKFKSGKLLFFVGSFAAVIILGFVGYTFIWDSKDNADNLKKIQGRVAMSEEELRDVVKANNLTAYWAGPVDGDKYSLIAQKSGQVFVRYLPAGRGLTETGNTFRIIATYPQKDAFSVTRSAGTQIGNIGFVNVDGNSVFYAKDRPTNVYIGIKDKDFQLEIFDPRIDQALGLSLIGNQIRQIS